ncbi:MAG: hypothetical protein GXZ15_04250 [Campylobacter sp.]|nr:hypothetical protein [Campylobacter sp.]
MRKILLILCLVVIGLNAKDQKLSNIPPASMEFIDVMPGICDQICLKRLIDNRQEFSFIARYTPEYGSEFKGHYSRLSGKSGTLVVPKGVFRSKTIAVMLPEQVIGGYAEVVANSVFSYVISEDINIGVKFYYTGTEDPQALRDALMQMEKDEIALVIAPLTAKGASYVAANSDQNMLFFIPTIHFQVVDQSRENIFFGGIDYEEQISKLLNISNKDIVLFSDGSVLGNSLDKYVESSGYDLFAKHSISGSKKTLLGLVDSKYNNLAIFLNLPLDKTAMVATELRLNGIKPVAMLTTQINYAPKLISTINYQDRENLYVANSITNIDKDIAGISSVLGVDMYYNWVAYSTAIGLDYLYSTYIDPDHKRVFSEEILGSSINYNTKIYKTQRYVFEEFSGLK